MILYSPPLYLYLLYNFNFNSLSTTPNAQLLTPIILMCNPQSISYSNHLSSSFFQVTSLSVFLSGPKLNYSISTNGSTQFKFYHMCISIAAFIFIYFFQHAAYFLDLNLNMVLLLILRPLFQRFNLQRKIHSHPTIMFLHKERNKSFFENYY